MFRKLLAILAVLSLIGTVQSADPGNAKMVILRWHGQSMFHLQSSQGTAVVFDPHGIEAYGRTLVKGDVILFSHFHNDHTFVQAVQNFKNARIIPGLKGTSKKLEWNIVDEKIKDLRIKSVGVYHDDTQGMERGLSTVFIIEVDGLRVVHLGDLGHMLTPQQIDKIKPVDVLMVPVGGIYTLNGSEAKRVVAQLQPRMYVVPMHYGTKVFDELLSVDEFLDEQRNVVRQDQGRPSNELLIKSDFRPREPITVVLNWK
jgi:L-ascorbate metabolism protein UlaG (beta-lactamase superfamily)